MKYRVYIKVLLVLLLNADCYAQEYASSFCKQGRVEAFIRSAEKKTNTVLEENNYDVQHVHIDIGLNNQSVAIEGNVTTTCKVLTDTLKTYVFELIDELQIDSIVINDSNANFSRKDDIVYAQLKTWQFKGQIIKATVYYRGEPEGGNVFFFQHGLNNATVGDWGSRVTYTLSEPYTAKGWYPCKQSLKR